MVHVERPFDLLARMLALRVHLDPVPVTNAPLLVAPGSHKRGRTPTPEIPDVVHQCGQPVGLRAAVSSREGAGRARRYRQAALGAGHLLPHLSGEWNYTIDPEGTEDNIYWKRFLGSAPKRPLHQDP